MTTSLYQLTSDFAALADRAFSFCEEGEVPGDLCEQLDKIETDIDEKLAACCRIVRTFEVNAKAVKEEADRLARKAAAFADAAKRIKENMHATLDVVGSASRKVDAVFTVRVQNNSQPSVVVDDLALVPANFDKQREREVDKTAIRDQLKKGVPVPGCRLVQGKHLRIR